jgi:hypothetical protein
MATRTRSNGLAARALFAGILAVLLAACGGGSGSGVSGVYVPTGDSLWKKFDFQSQGKVEVLNFADQTTMGEYAVMGDGRIKVMVGGDVLTLKKGSDGCLSPTIGDAAEAQQAQRAGESEEDVAQLGHFCKQ